MKTKLLLLLAVVAMLSCRTSDSRRSPQSFENIGPCPKLEAGEVNFETLSALIRSPACRIRTIDNVLMSLPVEFRENAVLFFKSRSLQGPHKVDYLNPRVIMFTPNTGDNHKSDGRAFYMTFNSETHHPGHNSIEFLEVNTKAADVRDMFRFGEIDFPKYETEIGESRMPWEVVQNQIHFSGFNPPRCTRCHGEPARPIFPGYPIWEGAFGSHKFKLPAEEIKGYLAFLDRAESVEIGKVNRYANLVRPSGNTKAKIAHITAKVELLNSDLGHFNGFRVGRLAQASVQFDKYKFAIAGAFNRCDGFPKFFPEALRADLYANLERRWNLKSKWTADALEKLQRKFHAEKNYVFLFVNDVDLPYDGFKKSMLNRSGGDENFLRLLMDTVSVQGISRGDILGANLRMVMEGRGLNIDNWFLDLTQPTYRFQSGIDYETSLETLMMNNSDLPQNLNERNTDVEKDCAILREKSLAALKDVRAPGVMSPEQFRIGEYPATFTRVCAQCHDDSELAIAPEIPFSNRDKFAAWLVKPGNLKLIRSRVFARDEQDRMPPTKRLTEAQLKSIDAFLKEAR